MSLLWNAQQREWLQALGHPVLVLSGAGLAEAALEPIDATSPPVAASPAAGDRPDADDLYRALLRATGQPLGAAERALRQLAIDSAVLRGDPAGKRALWPRLRRLRAGRPR